MSDQPRMISKMEAAQYCGLTPSGFSSWVRRGVLPTSVPGTNRWDRKAIDARLDRISGLQIQTNDDNDFDEMEAVIDARLAQRRTQGKKASR
ncbi:excisionase [Brucella phage BiPBO1]|uniref:excisionase n=1 Tax=Brucella phage BiPBO1 TaxID=1718278 RepID=UPI00078EC73B|nr:excisionase [Brucella phage BiPBO1]ALJ98252.1 excisionase [Brucella phage BiPBO1]